jgi:superfamily II DNA or RNA helicase
MVKKCFGPMYGKLVNTHMEAFRELNGIESNDDAMRDHRFKPFLRKKLSDEIYPRVASQVCKEMAIRDNQLRNAAIIRRAWQHREDWVLILVNSKEHGYALAEKIPGAVVAHSKMGAKARRQAIEGFRDGSLHCLIATSLADEGLDVQRANVLILACGGRAAGKVEQRTGRVLRSFEGKAEGIIYDFWDVGFSLTRNQAKRRVEVYQALGYTIDDGQTKLL